MAIEIAVYGALRDNGIEGTNGHTYYSYSSGFKNLAEQSSTLKSISRTAYEEPMIDDWMDHDEYGNALYPSADQTDYANKKEDDSQKYNPKMFLYQKIEDLEGDKYAFVYGKQMSFDWSNCRPNNPYHFTSVFDIKDIKKYPFMYSDSTLVTCDIKRSYFFPEKVGELMPEPRIFVNPASLESKSDTVYAPHTAGFGTIDEDEIVSYIESIHQKECDSDGIDILKSMVTALVNSKSNEDAPKIIIADAKDYILLWIAAVTYIFPLRSAKEVSFTTYGYRPSHYDINGVFVPELNNCRNTDGVTFYDFDRVSGSYAVFDFNRKSYAPEIEVPENDFMSMLNDAFDLDMSILNAYKAFVENETSYTAINADYFNGYYLYLISEKKMKLDTDKLSIAAEFLKKYANDGLIMKILKMMTDDCMYYITDEGRATVISEVTKLAVDKNLVDCKTVESQIIRNLYYEFENEKNVSFKEFINLSNAVKNVLNYSSDQMFLNLFEYYQGNGIKDLLSRIHDQKRLAYIFSSIDVAVRNDRTVIRPNSEFFAYETAIVNSLFPDESIASRENLRQFIDIEEVRFQRQDQVFDLYNLFMRAFADKRMKSMIELIQQKITEKYFSLDDNGKCALFNAMLKDDKFNDEYVGLVISKIASKSSAGEKIADFEFLISYFMDALSPYIEKVIRIIMEDIDSLNADALFDLLRFMYEVDSHVKVLNQDILSTVGKKIVFRLYREHSDFVYEGVNKNYEIIYRTGTQNYLSNLDLNIFYAFGIAYCMLENREKEDLYDVVKKNNVPDISKFDARMADNYLETVSKAMCANWMSTEKRPELFVVYSVPSPELDTKIVCFLARNFINHKQTRGRARNLISLMEICRGYGGEDHVGDIVSEIHKSDISGKELLHIIESDIKRYEKKPDDNEVFAYLQKGDLNGLQVIIEDEFEITSGQATETFKKIGNSVTNVFSSIASKIKGKKE